MRAPGGTFLSVKMARPCGMHGQWGAAAFLLESSCLYREFQLEITEPQINLNLCIAIKGSIWGHCDGSVGKGDATKSDSLSLISRPQVTERENQFLQVVL